MSELEDSGQRPNCERYMQNGEAFVIYNKDAPHRINVSLLHDLDHTHSMWYVRFSQDGRYICTTGIRTAMIFDARTGDKVAFFSHEDELYYDSYIRAITFTQDVRHLLCVLSNANMRVWNIHSGDSSKVKLELERDGLLDFSGDGSVLVWISGNVVHLWDVNINSSPTICKRAIIRVGSLVWRLDVSGDNKLVATTSYQNNLVKLWDTTSGTLVGSIQTARPTDHLALSKTGHKLLVLVEGSATITLRDFTDADFRQDCSQIEVHRFQESMNECNNWGLNLSFDDKWVFSIVDDGSLCLWSVDGEPQFILWAHPSRGNIA